MTTITVMASAATSGRSPRQYASAIITEPPVTTGTSGRRISRVRSARVSSHSASATATPTTTRKRILMVNRVSRARAPRARPTASAAGRLRPARALRSARLPGSLKLPGSLTLPGSPSVPGSLTLPGSPSVPRSRTLPGSPSVPGSLTLPGSPSVPGSLTLPGSPSVPGSPCWLGGNLYLEELGFLVPEQVVHLPHVGVGEIVEFPFRPVHIVLACVTALDELVQRILGMPADVADRDLAVLGLVPRDLDVFLPAILGEIGEDHPDDRAIVRRVHPEVAVPDRLLDRAKRGLVERLDDDHPRLGDMERGKLINRRRRSVVLGHDLAEHGRMRTPGADRGELFLGDRDGLLHFLLGLEESFVYHCGSCASWACLIRSSRQRASEISCAAYQRADLLTTHRPHDVALFHKVENDDGQAIVHTQAHRGRVHELQLPAQHLAIVKLVKPHRIRACPGIRVVDPVDLRALEHGLRPDLQSALRVTRIGGEEGRAEARAEDHDPALLQMPDGPPGNVGLGDLPHGDRGLHAGVNTEFLQHILEGEAVDHCAEHAH